MVEYCDRVPCSIVYVFPFIFQSHWMGRRVCARMVVGFTTTYAISATTSVVSSNSYHDRRDINFHCMHVKWGSEGNISNWLKKWF
jgi:hypothetical protein